MKPYKCNHAGRRQAFAKKHCHSLWLATLALVTAFICLAALSSDALAGPSPAKVNLRVLYAAGEPQSERDEEFVSFLKNHFTTVDRKDLAAFREQDADRYDAVVLDYGYLVTSNKTIVMPKYSFSKNYSRPTMTLGAAGLS
jgi:hypothetical protein